MPAPEFTYVICNCCPCCCEVINPYLEQRRKLIIHSRLKELLTVKLENIQKSSPKRGSELSAMSQRKELARIRERLKFHEKSASILPSPVVARSAFLAIQFSPDDCIHCGICASRCYFGARQMVQGHLTYDPQQCYGCGLCISTCPSNVIRLQKRSKVEYPKPIKETHQRGIRHKHPHGSS